MIEANSRGFNLRARGQSCGPGFNNPYNGRPDEEPAANLKLVPCRWAQTGWKYVKAEPAEGSRFFASPNRVNSLGHNFMKKAAKLNARHARASSTIREEAQEYLSQDEFKTSYNRFFDPKR
jgi:hypothetical protein